METAAFFLMRLVGRPPTEMIGWDGVEGKIGSGGLSAVAAAWAVDAASMRDWKAGNPSLLKNRPRTPMMTLRPRSRP